MELSGIDHETASGCVGHGRRINRRAGLALDVEREIARESCGPPEDTFCFH
jgi:hypothetical protein